MKAERVKDVLLWVGIVVVLGLVAYSRFLFDVWFVQHFSN